MPEFGQAPEKIAKDLSHGNIETAQRTAHSMKGAAAGIGAMALSRAAAHTEKIIAGKETDWHEALGIFKNELETVRAEISAYLDKELSSV